MLNSVMWANLAPVGPVAACIVWFRRVWTIERQGRFKSLFKRLAVLGMVARKRDIAGRGRWTSTLPSVARKKTHLCRTR